MKFGNRLNFLFKALLGVKGLMLGYSHFINKKSNLVVFFLNIFE